MKKRALSAIIALAIVIPLLIIGGVPLYFGIGVIELLAYKEIVTLRDGHQKLPDLVKVIGAATLLFLTFSRFEGYYLVTGISYYALALLLVGMLTPTLFYNNKYTTKDAFYMIGFELIVALLFNTLMLVYTVNVWYLVYLLLITSVGDSFAYIIGSLIGKHKFIPKVSPNKSVEGSIAGLLIGTFVAVMFFINVVNVPINIALLVFMTLVLGIAGQIGDLLFSKIKRENNIKDFSNIMPGHGGILDRLDSLSFVLLVFVIFMNFI